MTLRILLAVMWTLSNVHKLMTELDMKCSFGVEDCVYYKTES